MCAMNVSLHGKCVSYLRHGLKIHTFQEYTFKNINKIIINFNFRWFCKIPIIFGGQTLLSSFFKLCFSSNHPGLKSRH